MRAVDEKEPWRVPTRDEQRSLAITFLGGLGSIVVGACLIGAALAFDRTVLIKPIHPTGWVSMVVVTAGFFGVTGWFVRQLTRLAQDGQAARPTEHGQAARPTEDGQAVRWRGDRAAALVALLCLGGLDLFMLLMWVGIAAGAPPAPSVTVTAGQRVQVK